MVSMTRSVIYVIFFFSGTVIAIYFYLTLKNRARVTAMSGSQKRKADHRKLTKRQKKALHQAAKHHQQGNAMAAAQILETAALHREAINVLEKSGFIKEAANILLRLGSPGRAGVIFSRYKKWKEAADCYRMAKLPEKVGYCLKEAGQLEKAIPYFLDTNKLQEAAECYHELGKFRKAVQIYSQLGEIGKSITLLKSIVDRHSGEIKNLKLTKLEVKIIADYIVAGNAHTEFADLLVANHKLEEVIIKLIKKNRLDIANKIYLRSTSNIGPKLISYENFSKENSALLAKLFVSVSNYEYAGMVYERIQEFANAGHAFENDEDFERAAYCYDRAGLQEKNLDMRLKIAEGGGANRKRVKPPAMNSNTKNPFVMGEPTQLDDEPSLTNSNKPVKTQSPPQFVYTNLNQENSDEEKIKNRPTAPTPLIDPPESREDHTSVLEISLDGESHSSPPPTSSLEDESKTNQNDDDFSIELNELDFEKEAPTMIGQANLLKGLDAEIINEIVSLSIIERYETNTPIASATDKPVGIYFVTKGEVSCLFEGKVIEVIKPIDSFGELWTLIDVPQQVKYVASLPTEVHIVKQDHLTEIMNRNGTAAYILYRNFTQNLFTKLITSKNQNGDKIAS